MHDPHHAPAADDLHERAEAALGWIDEEASAVGSPSPDWAEQACEELTAGSATGRLLGHGADAA